MIQLIKLVLAVCILVLIAGCGGGSEAAGGNRTFGPLELSATSPKSVYALGESVPVKFSVKNTSTHAVETRGGSCTVEFAVKQGADESGPFANCGAQVNQLTFAPGETKVFDVVWEQRDLNGKLFAPGRDEIRIWFHMGFVDGAILTEAEAKEKLAANLVVITVTP